MPLTSAGPPILYQPRGSLLDYLVIYSVATFLCLGFYGSRPWIRLCLLWNYYFNNKNN